MKIDEAEPANDATKGHSVGHTVKRAPSGGYLSKKIVPCE